MINGIAKRYAILILNICKKKNILTEFNDIFSNLTDYLNRNRYIKIFINSPGVSVEAKFLFIDREISEDTSEIALTFLKLLIENNHQYCIDEIYMLFKKYSAMIESDSRKMKIS